MPQCRGCKKEVERHEYAEYCADCAADAWDRSFESSTEHSYEIGFKELVSEIAMPCSPACKRAIGQLLDGWHPLEWVCDACGNVLISKAQSMRDGKARTLNVVGKGCSCGGRVVPVPPKKFY